MAKRPVPSLTLDKAAKLSPENDKSDVDGKIIDNENQSGSGGEGAGGEVPAATAPPEDEGSVNLASSAVASKAKFEETNDVGEWYSTTIHDDASPVSGGDDDDDDDDACYIDSSLSDVLIENPLKKKENEAPDLLAEMKEAEKEMEITNDCKAKRAEEEPYVPDPERDAVIVREWMQADVSVPEEAAKVDAPRGRQRLRKSYSEGRRCSDGDVIYLAEEYGREVRVVCRCGAGERLLRGLARRGGLGGSLVSPASLRHRATSAAACDRRIVMVHLLIKDKPETVVFCRDLPQDMFREMLLGACGGRPCDILRVINSSGCLVPPTPDLPINTPATAYIVQAIAMNSDGEDEEGDDDDNDADDTDACSSIATAIPRYEKAKKTARKQQSDALSEKKDDIPDNVIKEPTTEETAVEEPVAALDEVDGVKEKPEQAVYETPNAVQYEPNESTREANSVELPEPVPSTSKAADLTDELESKPTMDRHKCRRRCCRPPPHTMSSEHIACLGGRILDTRRPSEPHHHLVWLRFLRLSEMPIPRAVRETLLTADFDSYSCADEKVIYLMQQMFFDLGLVDEFPIDLPILKNFLYEVYKHYNEVPFHNFRHCFCVAQMMFAMCMRAQLPNRIGGINVLILLVSCICHDLDHPGFNNIYQINARTELALRYNDISPLENHHCSVAFRILQIHECNIFRNFNQNLVRQIREGIIRCILATDMARHNEILAQFTETAGTQISATNTAHVNLLCMVLIKVADISNEVRPLNIAEPWLDRLLQEFFAQSDLEKRLGLPVTPFMDRDKVTKPSSQCAFIGLVLLPLFEALAAQLPCLEDILVAPAKAALEHYRRINEHNIKQRSMSADGEAGPSGVAGRSSISVDGAAGTDEAGAHSEETPSCSNAADPIIPDTSEAEQENEADVSEKALKFKIATEGSIERRSYPPSRKVSLI